MHEGARRYESGIGKNCLEKGKLTVIWNANRAITYEHQSGRSDIIMYNYPLPWTLYTIPGVFLSTLKLTVRYTYPRDRVLSRYKFVVGIYSLYDTGTNNKPHLVRREPRSAREVTAVTRRPTK